MVDFKKIQYKILPEVKAMFTRYEVVEKTKIKKNLIVHFKVKRWKLISVTNFVEKFINSWLNSFLFIQSENCRWTYIKFKVNSRSNYFSFLLGGVYGKCKGFDIDLNKAFKFQMSCKSNLYSLLV